MQHRLCVAQRATRGVGLRKIDMAAGQLDGGLGNDVVHSLARRDLHPTGHALKPVVALGHPELRDPMSQPCQGVHRRMLHREPLLVGASGEAQRVVIATGRVESPNLAEHREHVLHLLAQDGVGGQRKRGSVRRVRVSALEHVLEPEDRSPCVGHHDVVGALEHAD